MQSYLYANNYFVSGILELLFVVQIFVYVSVHDLALFNPFLWGFISFSIINTSNCSCLGYYSGYWLLNKGILLFEILNSLSFKVGETIYIEIMCIILKIRVSPSG